MPKKKQTRGQKLGTVAAKKRKYKKNVPYESPGGRIPFDWEQIDKLVEMGRSMQDIAYFFDCHRDTVQKAFKSVKGQTFTEYASGRKDLKRIRLWDRVWEEIEKGNTAVIIMATKNMIGWRSEPRDVVEVKVSSEAYRLHIVPPEDQPSETEEPAPSLN